MALETIIGTGTNGSYVYTSKMAVGDTTAGYFVGFKEGKFGTIIVLQNDTGALLDVLTSGSLRYAQKDAADRLAAGAYTVISKTGTKTTKAGKIAGQFSIQQDREKVRAMPTILAAAPAEATTAEAKVSETESVQQRLNNLKKKTG